jgi:Replication-relaxation
MNRQLGWLLSEGYLERGFRVNTFNAYQTPVYYLGKVGWRLVGNAAEDYKRYRVRIQRRSEEQGHTLQIYDVLLKFILESKVDRIIGGDDSFWQGTIELGNIPDAWIQFAGGELFIEVDRATERPVILRKKFENYTKFHDSGGYSRLFPNCGFKVLVFTTNEERIRSLEGLVRSDDIWFCTMEDFMREDLHHSHWFALNGFYALPAVAKEEV